MRITGKLLSPFNVVLCRAVYGRYAVPLILQKCDKKNFRGFSTTPCRREILRSLIPDVHLPDLLLPEFIFQDFDKFGDLTAVECSVTGRNYKYSEITQATKLLAANLRSKIGLQDGDVVTVIFPNIPEYAIASLGIIQANCVCSPLNPLYTPDELQKLLENSDSKCIITIEEIYPSIKAALKNAPKKLPVIVFKSNNEKVPDGTINAKELINPSTDTSILSKLKRASSNDVVLMPYSSGTTGFPKGVELTHRNIVSNITQFHATHGFMFEGSDPKRQDVVPALLPLFHIYGHVVILLDKLQSGRKVVMLPKFTSEWFIDMLKKHKPDIMFLVPPIALLMASHDHIKPEDLKNIRAVMSGAAPIGILDMDRLRKKMAPGVQIVQGYGLTETSPIITTYHKQIKNYHPGSIGGLVPNTEAKIVSLETGESLGVNKPGELVVRGPQVMKGYYKNESATKEVLDSNGWFSTGDVVYYDENGQIFVTDRLKELIKVKGFQVAPAELEEILRSFPGVDEAAVLGVAHPKLGEAPMAFIVAANKQKLSESDIKKFVADKVAPFKQLTGGVRFVESIPKNAAGKIQRRELKLKYDLK